MIQKIDLRELAEMHGPERAFVSCYVSDDAGRNRLEQRAERLRNMLDDEPEELEHFERSFAMIRKALDDHNRQRRSMAIFACWALDTLKAYELELELPSLLRIDSSPYIRPLAELQDEHETFLVVVADSEAARLLHVTSAKAIEADRISGGVKNKVKKGGWSQQRYARRRENELQRYAGDVAESIGELHANRPSNRIVLLGSDETMEAIVDQLDGDLRDHVIGRQSVQMSDDDRALVDEAYEMFWSEEREEEQATWKQIKNAYFSDGPAAAGPDEVLEAVMIGRVETIIVNRDAKIDGVRCRDCDNPAAGAPTRCPACGADALFPADLVNVLVAQAELTSAETEFTDEIAGLARLGHVAALLRY